MLPYPHGHENGSPGAPCNAPAWGLQAFEEILKLATLGEREEVLTAFAKATQLLGATAATFLSFVQDDALLATYRSIHLGHPAWPTEYAQGNWLTEDPWLAYAMRESEPALARDIPTSSPKQRAFAESASRLGYAAALIVPAPSPQGSSRVGVLCLGHDVETRFDDGQAIRLLLTRSLAMEMHEWVRRTLRDDLLRRTGLSQTDLSLLGHELAGRSSKAIAGLLGTEAKTIDCRFQRVCAKLNAPNRRTAVRVALLYGLL